MTMNTSFNTSGRPQGLLAKLAALALGLVALVVAFAFGIVIVAVVAVVGVVFWGYLWWKTRQLRRAMRDAAINADTGAFSTEGEGSVIDGEAVRIVEVERIAPPKG